MLTDAIIERILTTIPTRTIGVLGDLFLDRYLDIDAALTEPSIETGLDAFQVTRVRSYPGAAGTVINNLAALGVGRIVPISFIGNDGEGYELRRALAQLPSVVHSHLIATDERRTPTYTKPMLHRAGEAARELNRLDIKNRERTPDGIQDSVIEALGQAWPQFDALVVLDQVSEDDCGVVTERVREKLAELGEREPAKFMLADSRERIGLFRNVCVKPNEHELDAFLAAGWPNIGDALAVLIEGLMAIGKTAFVTHGVEGTSVYRYNPTAEKVAVQEVPAYPVSGPIDVVGAGDSCSAGIACAMVSGATHEQAAAFGNLVASITIQQIGVTGTATPEQVRQRWREVS